MEVAGEGRGIVTILTIATHDWVDAHLVRWVRRVRESNPSARLVVLLVGDGSVPVPDEVDDVRVYGQETWSREWCNEVRMGATTLLGEDAVLYCDCDADIVGSLACLEAAADGKTLGCCASPTVHGEWYRMCRHFKFADAEPYMNNGLLWLTDDWTERYKRAWGMLAGLDVNPRIAGSVAFNLMLRYEEGEWARFPDEYGCIWSDVRGLRAANVIQFCNDIGQKKRVTLERIWRAAQ